MTAKFSPQTLPEGWRDDVIEWAEHLRSGKTAESTIAGYALHVAWLARDVHDVAPTPWEVTPNGLAEWLAPRESSLATRRTVI